MPAFAVTPEEVLNTYADIAAANQDDSLIIAHRLQETVMALGRVKIAAEAGFAYDHMLERGNEAGAALIMGGVRGLINQTRSIKGPAGAATVRVLSDANALSQP